MIVVDSFYHQNGVSTVILCMKDRQKMGRHTKTPVFIGFDLH